MFKQNIAMLICLLGLINTASGGLSNPRPSYLSYDEIGKQITEWEREAADYVDSFWFGKTSRGRSILVVRVTNEKIDSSNKQVVLLTSCIHGNEPLSTATMMSIVGTILDESDKEQGLKKLLDTREIWFVPVVSPDTYPHSRHVDGVDPNRNFNRQRSIPPIQSLKDLATQIKPGAVASGHTFGRIYLYPWGDTNQQCKDHNEYVELLRKMQQYSKYKVVKGCSLYSNPVVGTEMDWYYRTLNSFSIIIEFGTHQRIPTDSEIWYEFQRNYVALLLFMHYGPSIIK